MGARVAIAACKMLTLDSSSVAVDLKFWPVAMLMLYSLGQLSLVKIEAS